jgi:hypothetical protein
VHSRLCLQLQRIAAADAGARGCAALVVQGDLARAALAFLAASSVLLLTGFPCRLACSPPAETDGPAGAVALAGAALALGKRVALATDDHSGAALAAALASRGAALAAACAVHAFPPAADAGWGASGAARLRRAALARAHAHTVAVERAGAAADGRCYTMRGLPMPTVAPLDCLMAGGPGVTSTGIGDGGNEAGMGRVLAAVHARIPLGPAIACVTGCDHLVAAGVSNWGAWALVGAVEAAARLGLPVGAGLPGQAPAPLPAAAAAALRLLPTPQQEEALAAALAAEGVGDGVTGQVLPPGSVDGLPAAAHHAKLLELRAAVDAALS